ncbi:ureidoglycine aminohydrolase [Striga asiatica]|uniref:Ureidoglycine aminohydrolase n=1 Tax=Striga asiatica TaxID=4170 RepID=A0A5A7PLP3_STRAF|nr:ureidoglycine aminohydrolase [Striga asiatica]
MNGTLQNQFHVSSFVDPLRPDSVWSSVVPTKHQLFSSTTHTHAIVHNKNKTNHRERVRELEALIRFQAPNNISVQRCNLYRLFPSTISYLPSPFNVCLIIIRFSSFVENLVLPRWVLLRAIDLGGSATLLESHQSNSRTLSSSRTNTLGAYLITPPMGSHFVMYLAKMQGGVLRENSRSGLPLKDVERSGSFILLKKFGIRIRFIFVLQGVVTLGDASGIKHELEVDSYAYLPPNAEHSLNSSASATLVIFERRHDYLKNHAPEQIIGSTDKQPLLETPGEAKSLCCFKVVFELRKLLPTTLPYDFNIHIMDFQPGEFLNVKEVHYNQHGLLLLEGQGIYRLGDSWYPVQSGDAIWMAPFVPQWYAALGKTKSRYLLYKDVNRNPL